ncbi:MAG: hypothetical protein WD077_08670 [Bacteroidia bacterium]
MGQDTLGGIVFHVYHGKDGKQHGLIVSKIEGRAIMGINPFISDSTRSWDGKFNTGLITNSPVKNWIQNNLDSNWYLPSIDELVLLWTHRFNVNKALSEGNHQLIAFLPIEKNANYWFYAYCSSNINIYNYVSVMDFHQGRTIWRSFNDEVLVRAVRSF